jgi:hypothetical protein
MPFLLGRWAVKVTRRNWRKVGEEGWLQISGARKNGCRIHLSAPLSVFIAPSWLVRACARMVISMLGFWKRIGDGVCIYLYSH